MIYNKDTRGLENSLDIDPRILRILINRDIESPEKIDTFLNPSLDKMYDPFLMTDMDKAVDLILEAIDEDKHIHIVGDYDQDGNSAIVCLMKGLGYLSGRLTYAIPDREQDGYGLNKRLVDEAVEGGADLLITCDNGIAAHEAASYAKEKGLSLIITDHHQVTIKEDKQVLPSADAVINPHRLDDTYPFKELCGAGVAFKLVQAIHQVLGLDENLTYDLLQFVAMGTVCDVVDLVDENRIIAKEGINSLNESDNLGIIALCEEASWTRDIDAYALGFVLGPCINASGRLSTARLGVELFLESDEDMVRAYASELVRLNNERKDMTFDAYEKIKGKLEESGRYKDPVIVVYQEGIHESIAGIVAGRIKDLYYRPTIVLTDSVKEGIIKGSGRSIEAYNMFEKVSEIAHITESFGGHEMACGLSLRVEVLEELRSYLVSHADLSAYELQREVSIDIRVPVDEIDRHLIMSLDKLKPFGKANPGPKLADKDVNILSYDLIGKNRNVLKINFEKNGQVREGISFNQAEETYMKLFDCFGRLDAYNPNSTRRNLIDLIYKPAVNTFNGKTTIQLRIEDMRISK